MRRAWTLATAILLAISAGAAAEPAAGARDRAPAPDTAHDVFRRYGGAGGIREEVEALAADHPSVAQAVTIGRTSRGTDIVALRVTARPRSTPAGRRPATLVIGGQHAREWVGPEVVRRLADHVVRGAGTDEALGRLVASTEVWFVPVLNPDGYDHSFTPGNRMWRKNLRDNDGDGRLTVADGVDLNRNFPTRWGRDDEASSAFPGGEAYRGPRAASEPETRALDGLLDDVGFEFLLNYHSASEQLLYGRAWRTASPTPDDVLYEAMAGDDANPAIPGLDPDRLTDLYTANGELTEHAHVTYGTLGFTPELSTCRTASASDPGDAWDPADCASAFAFPDDEALLDAEFRRTLPFALATFRSAPDPADPVTVTGRTPPEFVVDAFPVSYGDPQPLAVVARRDQRDRRLHWRVNGGPTQRSRVREWTGGPGGDERTRYHAEYRGEVTGAGPGDTVEAWFSARRDGRPVESEHVTWEVADDLGASALVVASEDIAGVDPAYPPGTTGPRHADDYEAALDANGVTHATWDVDRQGVPHPLGVLGHFATVVWETGDDRLVADADDAVTPTFLLGPVPGIAVASRQQALTVAVRDYLDEGGRLVHAGESAQYHGRLGRSLGGIYHGLDGAPDRPCAVTADFLTDCLILTDDMAQYQLGAYDRAEIAHPTGLVGTGPFAGLDVALGGPAVATNPLDVAGAFTLTDDVLSPGASVEVGGEAAGTYRGATGRDPFGPVEGARYAAAVPAAGSYQRIGRTADLTGVAAAEAPRLAMTLSFSTLVTFHHVIVEAAPAGTDAWTTLRDLGGRTSTGTPSGCADGQVPDIHPFLRHYLTPGGPGRPCTPTGTTGAWHAFTGESGGWVDAAFDLTPYAGGRVDLRVSYVTDAVDTGVGGGVGVFVDDTRIEAGGTVRHRDGFESPASGAWRVLGPPPGGPAGNGGAFRLGPSRLPVSAVVATDRTVLFGFGLESVADPDDRAALLGRALTHLGDDRPADP